MKKFEKITMTTLSECMRSWQAEGYTQNFTATERGLELVSAGKFYIPSEVKIINFYRFEGESDPADNVILYVIETQDGAKGLLVDSHAGAYANEWVARFVREVETISKQLH
jgi:hypothetical protein